MDIRAVAVSLSVLIVGACATIEKKPDHPATAADYSTVLHRYWDGSVSAGVSCQAGKPVLTPEYERPTLMALGDSIYNGVQSGRINWRLAEWSPPVYVAARLDTIEVNGVADRTGKRSFYTPQYPILTTKGRNAEFGANLEAVPGLLGLLHSNRALAQDLKYLSEVYRPPNGRPLVENLAFSGANSVDLVAMTPRLLRSAATEAIKRGKGRDAFTYLNAAFVLNPMRLDCLDDMTPLEQVALRKPRFVIINIGANNGIWRAGFNGSRFDDPACNAVEAVPAKKGRSRCSGTIRQFLDGDLRADIRTIMAELAKVDGVEGVYINGLIRPSRVANLVPTSDQSLVEDPAYAATYRLDLFGSKRVIPGTQVWRTDIDVDGVNRRLKSDIEAANGPGRPKFVFVDIDTAMAPVDYKRCLGSTGTPRPGCNDGGKPFPLGKDLGLTCSVSVNNLPARVNGNQLGSRRDDFCKAIESGGLFSIDNMHPSSIGYSLIAQAVRESMLANGQFPIEIIDRGHGCDPKLPQSCTLLLVEPGYSTTDSNLRRYEFLSTVGEDNRRHLNRMRKIVDFFQD